METTIHTVTPQHLPAILKIVNHNILHSTALYDYTPKDNAYIEIWYKEKTERKWPVIVAVQNNHVVGYGTYGTFRFKEGYRYTVEHSVYVSHEYTNKGIGKLLLAELIRLAKEEGYHTMIGGIDAENKGSIAFHAKFGFTEAGLLKEVGYKFGKWLDVQFMQLILK
jgi:L-amino acid N-acyltransferase YncA